MNEPKKSYDELWSDYLKVRDERDKLREKLTTVRIAIRKIADLARDAE